MPDDDVIRTAADGMAARIIRRPTRPVKRRRWWPLAAALAVVLLVVAVGGVFGVKWWHRHQSCQANAANAHAATRTIGTGAPALLVGDSWASGWTLPSPADGFPARLAAAERWRLHVDAYPGTGWTNSGPCGGATYAARLTRDTAPARTVVIEGGLNDRQAPGTTLRARALSTLAQARRAHPAARIVVVGPPTVTEGGGSAAVDGALRAAASAEHVGYVSTLRWPVPLGPDGLHPTVTGQAVYARRLAAALHSPGV